jgi:hypothetical protein
MFGYTKKNYGQRFAMLLPRKRSEAVKEVLSMR